MHFKHDGFISVQCTHAIMHLTMERCKRESLLILYLIFIQIILIVEES